MSWPRLGFRWAEGRDPGHGRESQGGGREGGTEEGDRKDSGTRKRGTPWAREGLRAGGWVGLSPSVSVLNRTEARVAWLGLQLSPRDGGGGAAGLKERGGGGGLG